MSAIVLFVIALARGYGFTYAIVYGFVLVLVGNVPEGLPTTVVTVLALTAQRMAEFKILIKRTDIIGECVCVGVRDSPCSAAQTAADKPFLFAHPSLGRLPCPMPAQRRWAPRR